LDALEAELRNLVESPYTPKSDPAWTQEREALWQESCNRYDGRRQEEMRAAWCEYHLSCAESLRRTLEALITHHETQARTLMETKTKKGMDS
jgi:hypothetical protein